MTSERKYFVQLVFTTFCSVILRPCDLLHLSETSNFVCLSLFFVVAVFDASLNIYCDQVKKRLIA